MKKSLLALAVMAVAFSAHAQQSITRNADGTTTVVDADGNKGTYDKGWVVSQNTSGPGSSADPKLGETKKESFWSMPKFSGPIGYPGNTWGTLVYGVKTPNGDTTPRYRIEGVVEQGIDWFRFGDGTWKYNTYIAGEYVINSNDSDATPVIGMKVNKRFEQGSLDLGLRYKYGNTYISPTGGGSTGGTDRKGRIEVHATYWFDWNLKKD